MKKIVIGITFLTATIVVVGQDKNKKMAFEVDGICVMCKMRIEKAALGVPGVKYANWDIPTHQLSLILDERKTNSMEIKTALVEAGHDTKELKATEEAYNQVHPCCRYRDIEVIDSHEEGGEK